jgi:phospholipid/cholesterol/gamma-HCH transport system permease protein
MEDSQPRISLQGAASPSPAGRAPAQAQVLGRWTAAQLTSPQAWQQLEMSLESAPASAAAAWDLRLVQRLDHIGAQLLWNHWGQQWPKDVLMLPSQRTVLERVARFTVQLPVPPRRTFWQRVDALGAWLLQIVDHARAMVILVGQLALDIVRLIRYPAEAPWRDISGHLYRIGTTAMPITAVVGFLIGVVLAYLMSQQLRQFGADTFIVDILGVALIRELGPVLAAILIAGRSGSAITAQIGVMRVTEELDAMRVMGIAHGFRLVLPRAIALAIAMPLISVWTTLVSLGGGILASDFTLGLSPSYFVTALPAAVAIPNLYLALGKSVVFGVVIALVGCHFGLRVEPNTESLGEGTTASVVTAITVVILVDAAFAILFSDVGI